ncbi:MAG: cytochrome c oxidase subunit II [Pseudanabaenaceae cyanobacterium bins.68]|nr:cytochrome c oxidase subunit II [Pseudanabaenaceae cyanobacterium bins.68]
MAKTTKIISISVITILIVAASLWYGSHNGLLPSTASGEAELYDRLFNQLLVIATGLFLLIQGLILFCVFKFRQAPGDQTDGAHVADNALLELAWTAVPTVIVLWIGITSFDVYNVMHYQNGDSGMMAMAGHMHQQVSPVAHADTLAEPQAQDPDELVVEVAGMQYAWIFTYPGTEIVSGELHLPVGRKVRLNISANDVIHAFWVPQLRMKQDAVPGETTHMEFKPNQVGTYPIVCAELCGSYHGGMRAEMYVETPEQFQAWLAENQAESGEEVAQVPDAQLLAQIQREAMPELSAIAAHLSHE